MNNLTDDISELQSSLESFIKVQTIDYYDKIAVKAIENARSNTIDIEDVIKKWEKLFKEVHFVSHYLCLILKMAFLLFCDLNLFYYFVGNS